MRESTPLTTGNDILFRGLFERTPKYRELEAIIAQEKIDIAFQPLFDLQTGTVVAHEALCRVTVPNSFKHAGELFETAERIGLLGALEKICQRKAVEKYTTLGLTTKLCINVSPGIVSQASEQDFERFFCPEILEANMPILLEITERRSINEVYQMKAFIQWLRHMRFQIALDDLGAGFAGLKCLLELEPSVVKIDRHLISGIHQSTKKQLLCNAIVSFCRKIGTIVVAEGVETKEELGVVADMRCDWVQGFYLGEPMLHFDPQQWALSDKIQGPSRGHYLHDLACSGNLIGCLTTYVAPIEAGKMIKDVEARFKSDETLTVIPILDGNTPVGIVKKTHFFYTLGQQYGYALYASKPISLLMKKAFICEADTPIEIASQKITARDEDSIYDAVIVTRNGSYVGIVKIYHILEHMTRQSLLSASQANPLTGLPGNNLIKEEVTRRLEQGAVFAAGYVDLDHFKPFNDRFGFERGDQVIRFLGQLLKEVVTSWDPQCFVGHIGGDDFVFVVRAAGVERLCQRILDEFQSKVGQFYDSKTLEQGYYEAYDRKGNICRFPNLSLSIGVVTNSERVFKSYGHLASVATEVKSVAKKILGNSYHIDRRRL